MMVKTAELSAQARSVTVMKPALKRQRTEDQTRSDPESENRRPLDEGEPRFGAGPLVNRDPPRQDFCRIGSPVES